MTSPAHDPERETPGHRTPGEDSLQLLRTALALDPRNGIAQFEYIRTLTENAIRRADNSADPNRIAELMTAKLMSAKLDELCTRVLEAEFRAMAVKDADEAERQAAERNFADAMAAGKLDRLCECVLDADRRSTEGPLGRFRERGFDDLCLRDMESGYRELAQRILYDSIVTWLKIAVCGERVDHHGFVNKATDSIHALNVLLGRPRFDPMKPPGGVGSTRCTPVAKQLDPHVDILQQIVQVLVGPENANVCRAADLGRLASPDLAYNHARLEALRIWLRTEARPDYLLSDLALAMSTPESRDNARHDPFFKNAREGKDPRLAALFQNENATPPPPS